MASLARGHDEDPGRKPDPDAPSSRAVEPEAGEEPTVVVRGAFPDVAAASTHVITAREMSAVPRRTAEDGLRLAPGVTLVQHGTEGKGVQFFVRGFDAVHGADFEITLEGIPLNEWSNIHAQGYLDLGIVIPETVESIRVTKGPFTLDQGAFAMAGSADYHVGIPASDRGTRLAYTVGTTQRHRGVMTHSLEGTGGHDFIASETLVDQGFGERRSIGRGVAMARKTIFSSHHGTLSYLGAAQVARFELPTPLRNQDVSSGKLGFFNSYDDRLRGESLRGLSGLSYAFKDEGRDLRAVVYGGYRRLELLENFTGFLRDPENGDRRLQQQEAWSFGAHSTYLTSLSPNLALKMGLGVRGEVLRQTQDHVGVSEEHLDPERDLSGLQTLSHGVAGFILRPVETVRIDAGARADVAQLQARDNLADSEGAGTLAMVSPRSIVEWRVAEPLRLFGSYGRGLRPPELRAFSSFAPEGFGLSDEVSDRAKPRITVADAFELGARAHPHRFVSTSLSMFATFIQAENVFDHVSGTNVELNPTRRLGAEMAVRAHPNSWLLLTADATYVDARFSGSENVVPFAPRVFGNIRAVATPSNGWRGGLRYFAVAPRPLPHGARGATWTQLDATLGHHFKTWRLDLELENLLGQRVREGEFHFTSNWEAGASASRLPALHYYAGPPRNARVTLTALF